MSQKHQPLQERIESWIIRARRAKLTQKELARLANVPETHLSRIIGGHVKSPQILTIDRVEAILASKGV